MPRPKDGYKLKDGTKVPGVGDITGRYADKGALITWAFRQGKAGEATLYGERDRAADIGTAVHDMIDMELEGRSNQIDARASQLNPETRDKAMKAFGAFIAWRRQYQIKVVASEVSLVSEQHRYGGTLDKVITINGSDACHMLDFKTGKDIYVESLLQLGAYKGLWSEARMNTPLDGFHILRCDKTTGEFEHRYFANLDEYLSLFLLYRQAYDIDKKIGDRKALVGTPFGIHIPAAAIIALPPAASVAPAMIEPRPNLVPTDSTADALWLAARAGGFAACRTMDDYAKERIALMAGSTTVAPDIYQAAVTMARAAQTRLENKPTNAPASVMRGEFHHIEVRPAAEPDDVFGPRIVSPDQLAAMAAKLSTLDAG